MRTQKQQNIIVRCILYITHEVGDFHPHAATDDLSISQ